MDRIVSTVRRISPGFLLLIILGGCSGSGESTHLTGSYLGQDLPGDTPALFAPGLVSTPLYNRDLVLTTDGDEIYFGVFANSWYGIAVAERAGDRWSEPRLTRFSTDTRYMSIEPALSEDGNRIYFLSNRPPVGREDEFQPGSWGFQNIWFADRTVDGWSDPEILPPPVNSDENEFFPSLTRDGTLYFSRTIRGETLASIYRARPDGNGFAEPELIGADWNRNGSPYNAFIDRDERFLLFCMEREGSIGTVDYWVSLRNSDDSWSDPVNLWDRVRFRSGPVHGGWCSDPRRDREGTCFFLEWKYEHMVGGRFVHRGPAYSLNRRGDAGYLLILFAILIVCRGNC